MNAHRRPITKTIAGRLGGIGLAVLLGFTPIAQAQPVGIPSMGAASTSELSPLMESTLGEAIMEQGRRDPSYIDDPDVGQYLTNMGRKLVAQSPRGTQPITVFAVRDPQINAFALPGGYIGVNSGLVVSAKNESELASVIAHEIGHVVLRHIARGMTQRSQSSGVMIASLVAALLAGLAGSGDLAMGVAAFGQAAAIDQQMGFSRQAEQEADRVGFTMLRNAGFDPRGMVEMFQQLMNASRLNEGAGGNAYTSTHPLSVQRISDIGNRVSEVPPVHHRDSAAFWYIRAKLRLVQARDNDARRAAVRQLQLDAQRLAGVPQSAAWYGLAYAAWQNKNVSQATAALENARKNSIESPEIARLAASIAISEGNYQQALTLTRAAWTRWPQSQGVALAVIQAMQKSGNDTEAVQFIGQRLEQWADLPSLYKLQAQSYERLGQQVPARRAMALYYEHVGALGTAVEQLRQARDLSDDFYVQSEIDAQIRTLRERVKSQRELLERFKSG